MFRPNPTAGYRAYQPDIKDCFTPDIMSCHPFAHPLSEKAFFFVFFKLMISYVENSSI